MMRDIFELEQIQSLSAVLTETARRSKHLAGVKEKLDTLGTSGDGRIEITIDMPDEEEPEDEYTSLNEMVNITEDNRELFSGIILAEMGILSKEYQEASEELDTLLK